MKYIEKTLQVKANDMTYLPSLNNGSVSQQTQEGKKQGLPGAVDIEVADLLHISASVCGDFSFDYCAFPT